MTTILTGEPSPEWVEAEKERDRKYKAVKLLCEAWYLSVESGSISRKKAIEEIISVTSTSFKNGHITRKIAERLTGEFVMKCSDVLDIGADNGKPTGMVKLIKECSPVLNKRGYKTAPNKDKESMFELQSETLKEYGVFSEPGTIKSWFYSKK